MKKVKAERALMDGSNGATSPGSSSNSSLDISSLQRQQRNLAEKQRRDKFNGYIHELASIVPMIAKTAKRLDKTSILRLTAAHMRLHLSSLSAKNGKRKPYSFPEVLKANLSIVQEAVGGFLMVVACTGKIIFTSSDVESYIGHQDIDMMGHSLYFYIHSADLPVVKKEMENLVLSSENSSSESRTTFCVHVREHSQPRSETVSYRTMLFFCSLNPEDAKRRMEHQRVTYSKSQKIASNLEYTSLIKMFVQPVEFNPLNELSLTEAFQDQYVTRHGLKGEILYADHRISTITGHLPNEVRGMSAYQYIFSHDVPVALFAQKLMFSSHEGKGMIVYRLRTRSDAFVYLQSTGFLEYKESSTEISEFVCYNKLLSDEEGSEELKKFQDRFMPHIKEIEGNPDLDPQYYGATSDACAPALHNTQAQVISDPLNGLDQCAQQPALPHASNAEICYMAIKSPENTSLAERMQNAVKVKHASSRFYESNSHVKAAAKIQWLQFEASHCDRKTQDSIICARSQLNPQVAVADRSPTQLHWLQSDALQCNRETENSSNGARSQLNPQVAVHDRSATQVQWLQSEASQCDRNPQDVMNGARSELNPQVAVADRSAAYSCGSNSAADRKRKLEIAYSNAISNSHGRGTKSRRHSQLRNEGQHLDLNEDLCTSGDMKSQGDCYERSIKLTNALNSFGITSDLVDPLETLLRENGIANENVYHDFQPGEYLATSSLMGSSECSRNGVQSCEMPNNCDLNSSSEGCGYSEEENYYSTNLFDIC